MARSARCLVFQTRWFVHRPARLLAEDGADQLDHMTFGPELFNAPADQRRRGSSFIAKRIDVILRVSLTSFRSRFWAGWRFR